MAQVTTDMLDEHLLYDHETGELYQGGVQVMPDKTGLVQINLPLGDDGDFIWVKMRMLKICWRMAYGDLEGGAYVAAKNGKVTDTRLTNLQLVYKASTVRKAKKAKQAKQAKQERKSYPKTLKQWGPAHRDKTKKAFATRLLKEVLATELRNATIESGIAEGEHAAEARYEDWLERKRQEEIAWRREAGLRD